MSSLMLAFFTQVGIVTYRTITQGGQPTVALANGASIKKAPLPSTYTSVMVVYAALGLMPRSLGSVPGLIGWGFVVATLLNLFTPGSANAAAQANAQLGSALTSSPNIKLPNPIVPQKAPGG